jgi:hypothetical protein
LPADITHYLKPYKGNSYQINFHTDGVLHALGDNERALRWDQNGMRSQEVIRDLKDDFKLLLGSPE